MVRAAADGIIDFSACNTLDRHWPIRLAVLLDQAERKYALQHAQFSMLRHALLLSSGAISEEAAKYHFDSDKELHKSYLDLLLDRKPEDEATRQQQVFDAWRTAWQEHFGDLRDPQTQANIDAVANWLERQRTEAS